MKSLVQYSLKKKKHFQLEKKLEGIGNRLKWKKLLIGLHWFFLLRFTFNWRFSKLLFCGFFV